MESCSWLLAVCAGFSAVPGEFPAQRPVAQSFDVFFDLNGWVNNREAGDLRRHRAHYDVIVMFRRSAIAAHSTDLICQVSVWDRRMLNENYIQGIGVEHLHNMMTSWHDDAFNVPTHCRGNPLVIGGYLSQRVSNSDFWFYLCCYSEQAVEKYCRVARDFRWHDAEVTSLSNHIYI